MENDKIYPAPDTAPIKITVYQDSNGDLQIEGCANYTTLINLRNALDGLIRQIDEKTQTVIDKNHVM